LEVAAAVFELMISGAAGDARTVIASERGALPPASLVAVKSTINVPVADGVPVMTPVAAFSARPSGRPAAV
jgi:hypothetical protein